MIVVGTLVEKAGKTVGHPQYVLGRVKKRPFQPRELVVTVKPNDYWYSGK
jgi:hypothetical protein